MMPYFVSRPMRQQKRRTIPAEELAQRRYEREAVRRCLPKKYWLLMQILAEGAEYRRAPTPNTLLELIDAIVQPLVRTVGGVLELADWARAPTAHRLDHIIAEKAHVLYAAGIPNEVVWELVGAAAVPEEGSSYIHGVHHRLARRF